MSKYEPRRCIICGKEYEPRRFDQKSCGSKECRRTINNMAQAEYRRNNYVKVLESNRNYMARKREEAKHRDKQKEDTIVAIGYAERQIASTLARAGKVRTEL